VIRRRGDPCPIVAVALACLRGRCHDRLLPGGLCHVEVRVVRGGAADPQSGPVAGRTPSPPRARRRAAHGCGAAPAAWAGASSNAAGRATGTRPCHLYHASACHPGRSAPTTSAPLPAPDSRASPLPAPPGSGSRAAPSAPPRVPLVEVSRPVQLPVSQLGGPGAHRPAPQVRGGERLPRPGQVRTRRFGPFGSSRPHRTKYSPAARRASRYPGRLTA